MRPNRRTLKLYRPHEYWVRRVGDNILDAAPMVEVVRRIKPYSVLEVGCGTGLVLEALVKMVPNVVGVDFSKPRIQKSKRISEVVLSHACNLPFRKCSFDIVLTRTVLMHVPPENIEKAVHEMVRVSKRHVACEEFYSYKEVQLDPHCFNHEYPTLFHREGLKIVRHQFYKSNNSYVFIGVKG